VASDRTGRAPSDHHGCRRSRHGGRAGDSEDPRVRPGHRGAGHCGYARGRRGGGHPCDPDLVRAGALGRACVLPRDPARLESAVDGPRERPSRTTRARRRAGVVRARRWWRLLPATENDDAYPEIMAAPPARRNPSVPGGRGGHPAGSGSRRADEPRSWGSQIVPCDEVRTWAPAEYGARVRERIGDGPAYLSFDIDVLDPAFAPGTGTPEVAGCCLMRRSRSCVRSRVSGSRASTSSRSRRRTTGRGR
jgi:hypothetical protein